MGKKPEPNKSAPETPHEPKRPPPRHPDEDEPSWDMPFPAHVDPDLGDPSEESDYDQTFPAIRVPPDEEPA